MPDPGYKALPMTPHLRTLAALVAFLFLSIVSARALRESWPETNLSSRSAYALEMIPTVRKIIPLSGYFEGQKESEIRRKATPSCEAKAYTLQTRLGLFPLNYSVSIIKSLEVFQHDHYWIASCVFEVLDLPKIQKLKLGSERIRKKNHLQLVESAGKR